MKGKILGFTDSAGTGAIAAENGERFSFVAAQWRSDKPIAVGMTVDFAPVAGVATEIYPVAGGAAIAASDLAASPAAQKARTLMMTTLVAPLALLLLIASFLPAISSPVASASIWGLGSVMQMASLNPLVNDDVASVQAALKQLDEREARLRAATTGFAGMPIDNSAELKMVAEERASAEARLSSARFASTVSSLLIVRWLVPVLAIALLAMAWLDKPVNKVAIGTGAVAIVTAALIYEYRQILVGGSNPAGSLGSMISERMSAIVSIGFGTWLIALCGIGLVVAGLGMVKNPLAAKA